MTAEGLAGRVALVTGASRGIGRAIALGLAADGADVAVNYRREGEAAEEVVAEVEKLGRRAIALQGSIDSAEDCRALADAASAFGSVDILVNNAGVASRGNSTADTDPEEFERLVRVHALGPAWLSGALVPGMRERPRGDVVFISSAATRHMAGWGAPYNMGKAAMEALALTLAAEERSHNIHVNIVAPGLVKTDMGRRLMKAYRRDIDEMDEQSPFGRVCRPEDVADVVRWVVSDAAGYVTRQRIYVDGGGS